MIHRWKCSLLEVASGLFERGGRKKPKIDEEQVEFLAKIGKLTVPNFLGTRTEAPGGKGMCGMIEPDLPQLSIGDVKLVSIAPILLLQAEGRDPIRTSA